MSTAAIFSITYASVVGALATQFVIAATRRTIARIHAQADHKEQ
ncbi:hypothetical protein [Streptomyces sp. YS-3]